jgi:16S rRNA C967 or C1407 C5-methylase (RsmB/RsmF family)/NOL1/NOP2/fmu family ribosome biogenesis protein
LEQRLQLPEAFRNQMRAQLGSEYALLEAALDEPAPVSVRFNPSKIPNDHSEKISSELGDQVRWHPGAYYLPQRPVFTLDPVFHAGGYYVQEASSMILREAFRQLFPTPFPLRALDLCAAPGGKSTLLAATLPSGSLLLANEVIRSRVSILKDNLDRWGTTTTVTSNYDPEAFGKLNGFFDVVLVDAPCSGEGMFRKDPQARSEWSEEHVKLCAARQRRILSAATKLLAPGGILIYSTCTYNDQENAQNAEWLSTQQQLTPLELTLPTDWNVVQRGAGYQLYPHRVTGEGFYFAVFRQTRGAGFTTKPSRHFDKLKPIHKKQEAALGDWLIDADDNFYMQRPDETILAAPKDLKEDLLFLDNALPQGVWLKDIGQFKGKDFIPSHALSLSLGIRSDLPGVELDKETSLHFLKKELIELPVAPKGWLLARYEGLNLGWMKNLGNRMNNYLPKDWRIRMDISEV